ncbi:MAG: acylphosphatase, partial [Terriglobales bacterium]
MARQRLEVTGNVQGVGFRPFVYRLAHGLGLGGFVCNAVGGVLIEVQGPALALTAFAEGLCQQPPPLARVAGVR